MGAPLVAFGCPTYNHARQLPQAIESLLSQTYSEFRLVLVDDCSSDETPAIAERYAQLDPRMVVVRNPTRLGYIRNARKCFDLARELFPETEYFAWASDHDVWHPGWLRSLVRELEHDSGLVLAYPMTVRISDEGEFRWEPRRFDTYTVTDVRRRVRMAFTGMAAGDMIYGLFRRSALERVDCLAPTLLPDRLLLMEIAMYGRFKQVPDVLWYRRYWGLASYRRQRAAFFPHGYPLYSYLPWWLVHAAILFSRLAIRGVGRPEVTRFQGSSFSMLYVLLAIMMQARRWFRAVRRGVRWTRKHGSAWKKRVLRMGGLARKAIFGKRIADVLRARRGGYRSAMRG